MNMLGPGQSLNYDDWYRQWFSGRPGGAQQAAPEAPAEAPAFESPFQAAMPEVPAPTAKQPQAFAPQPQRPLMQGGVQSVFEGLDPLRQEMAMATRRRLGMG